MFAIVWSGQKQSSRCVNNGEKNHVLKSLRLPKTLASGMLQLTVSVVNGQIG
jgi:hypothetical protein